ncbi:hypothetical protein GCM10027348_02530 [Hymenobacter tenuis]
MRRVAGGAMQFVEARGSSEESSHSVRMNAKLPSSYSVRKRQFGIGYIRLEYLAGVQHPLCLLHMALGVLHQ